MLDNEHNTYTMKEMIEEFRVDTKESLNRIEAQTTKTNGRVTASEKDISDIKSNVKTSKAQVWTAISVLLLVGATVITLGTMVLKSAVEKWTVDKNQQSINTAVSNAFDEKFESLKEIK